jgi:hypothetical protein
VSGGVFSALLRQLRVMHGASLMQRCRSGAWAVAGKHVAQVGQSHILPMLGYQALKPQPAASVAAMAGDLKGGDPAA